MLSRVHKSTISTTKCYMYYKVVAILFPIACCAVFQAVQAVLTLWENADSLRVLPFQAGDAADDGDCGDEMNGGGEVAPELGPPDSDDNGAMAIDSAPPPYSASPSNVSLSVTCDLQPLLVADD